MAHYKAKKGKFIVIEGGEGSGKTSVINYLKQKFPKFIYTREPGGTLIGQKIRQILLSDDFKPNTLTELFLFCADRAQHIEETIGPAIGKGKNVICDRFDYSTFAYQIFGRQHPEFIKTFKILNGIAKNGIEPDVTIYLDVDPKVGLMRKEKQKTELNRFEKEKIEFHKRVRSGFLAQFKNRRYSKNKKRTKLFFIKATDKNFQKVKEEVFKIIQHI